MSRNGSGSQMVVVVHTFNFSIWEAEVRQISVGSRPTWSGSRPAWSTK